MTINKIIIHELKKESGQQNTRLSVSTDLLPVDNESSELINTLLKSYKDDKISYAEFNDNPGRYFPEQYKNYIESERNNQNFIEFTRNTIGNLETLIKTKILAKGGYVVFSEYESNSNSFIAIFLIRDTEGKLLRRTRNSFQIQKIEYLDTNHLAMACKINESKIQNNGTNYLSFTKLRQQNISDYFTDWICIKQLETSTEFTNTLYNIINAIETPINPESNIRYTIDEVRNMVYENAINNAQKNINLRTLSEQIYGDQNTIINYAEEHNLSIDSEFRYNQKALKRFIQISVNKDGITLKYSRGDDGTKVKISEENPNMVIIESEAFANALRQQLGNV